MKKIKIFELNDSKDMLAIFKMDLEEFSKDSYSIRKCMHCILTGWHLIDWAFKESKSKNSDEFRKSLFKQCPDLKILHDLASSYKHLTISRPKTDTQSVEKHQGGFKRGDFAIGDFDVSCLQVVGDEKKECIDLILDRTLNFWTNYLK